MALTLCELQGNFLAFMRDEVKAGRRRPRTLAYYVDQLQPFVQANGGRVAGELVAYDLVKLPRTWHKVQAVQRLFRWGCDMGLIQENPFARLERPPAGQRGRVLERDELARLVLGAGRPARRLLLSLRHTIARPGELRDLTWPAFLEDLQAFELIDFKGRSRRQDGLRLRLIPLDGWMTRMVVRWRRRRMAGHVFTNSRGMPWTANGLRLAVRRARIRAALVDGLEPIVAYTIRHTAATWATAAGVRDRLLADLMGHANTRTTGRYQHLSAQHLAEAIRQATGRKSS